MNIDLLIGQGGQACLVCKPGFSKQPAGAIYDAQSREVTLEYADDNESPLHLNIAVEERFSETLLLAHRILIAVVEDGQIADALDVPMLYLNDPLGGGFGQRGGKPRKSVIGLEQFIKRSQFAQSLHREDLGDETTVNGVLGGDDIRGLTFSPALTRQRQLEQSPHLAPTMPTPNAPGMGLGGRGATTIRTSTGGTSEEQ